jgi:plasmid stability protein
VVEAGVELVTAPGREAPFTWYVIPVTTTDKPRRRGRRSLSGAGDSPQLRVRLPDELRAALSRRAALQGVTVSELARSVLRDVAEDRPENRVQLELHKAVLGKLLGDLGPAREIAHRNVQRMRTTVRGDQAQGWLDEWEQMITDPGPRLVEVFVGGDEHSIDLRQVSPFAGVLSQPERLAAIKRARGHAPH